MARESTIRVLRSTGSTDPTGLTFGELAYTDANGKLFVGTTAGTSLWIGAGITTGGIATNSETLVPTQSAVKSYVDGVVGGGSVVNTFNGSGGAITLTGSGAILNTQSGGTNTISVRVATTGATGVASFNSASFDVTAGDVTIKAGGVTNGQLANSSVTVSAGSGLAGGGAVSLGGSVTLSNAGVTGVVAGTGIAVSSATGNVTISNNGVQTFNGSTGAISLTGNGAILNTQSGLTSTISVRVATTGVTGVASFNSASFDVTGGDVTIKTSGVSNTQLANSSVTVSAGSGLAGGGAVALGGSVTLTNAGVTGVVAGTGIAVSGATGNVTISNNGVQSVNSLTGAVTGIATTAGKLSQFAATTSAELAGVVSDETGSGLLVFATGPTFTSSINTNSTTFTAFPNTATTLNFGSGSTACVVSTGSIFGQTGTTLASTQTVTIAGANTNAPGGNKTVNIGTGSGTEGAVIVNIGQSPVNGTGQIKIFSDIIAQNGAAFTTSGPVYASNLVHSVNGITGAISLTGNGAILNTQSGGTNTISVRVATTGATGVASFNSASFDVTAGDVTIKAGGVTNGQLANSSVTVSAGGTSTLNLGDTLTLTGGSNITLSTASNTVTLGLANDIVIAGNLTVNGTVVTANVDSFIVEDSMFALGTGNSADSLDIGFYGIYTNSTQRSFTGLFRDASDSGKYKMYTGLTGAEPTTTVNTAAAGYAVATLVVNIDGGTF